MDAVDALRSTSNRLVMMGFKFVTGDATRWSWIVGIGIEYAFAQEWSVKAEYTYMEFRTERILLTPTSNLSRYSSIFDDDSGEQIQVVKVGLNYEFDGPDRSAKILIAPRPSGSKFIPDLGGVTSDQRAHGGLFGRFSGGASLELAHRLPPTNEDGVHRRPIGPLCCGPGQSPESRGPTERLTATHVAATSSLAATVTVI